MFRHPRYIIFSLMVQCNFPEEVDQSDNSACLSAPTGKPLMKNMSYNNWDIPDEVRANKRQVCRPPHSREPMILHDDSADM